MKVANETHSHSADVTRGRTATNRAPEGLQVVDDAGNDFYPALTLRVGAATDLGNDTIEIFSGTSPVEGIPTAETDTTLVLHPDGSGGTVWGVDMASGGAGGGFDVTPPQSVPMPAWVKPTGSGVITNDAQGKITLDSGSGFKAFPSMAFLEGRLHLVHLDGTSETDASNVIRYRYSDNLGRTISTTATIISPVGGEPPMGACITALSSGRLLVTYYRLNAGSAVSMHAIYSDNRGQSWSSEYDIPFSFSGQVASASHPLELPDGSILVGGYGDSGGNFEAVVWKSTDGGLTFPTEVTIAASGSRSYYEPVLRLLASGKIVCLLRTSANHTYRSVSTDGGATWSAATDVLTATGRPDFVEFYPGALIYFGRDDAVNQRGRWAVSWDEGATWTALQEVDTSASNIWAYAAPVVLAPGYVAMVYSLLNSSSDADLFIRYYHDGYGMDPLGNISVLTGGGVGTGFATPAIVLGTAAAAGAATTVIRSDSTIVAFDATAPTTQAFGDAAATGSAAVAARRDHLHGMPAAPAGTTDHEHIGNVTFNGDGVTVAFELPAAPFDENSVIASVAGVIQDVTLSGTMLTTMTFGSAPASGTGNVRADIIAAAA